MTQFSNDRPPAVRFLASEAEARSVAGVTFDDTKGGKLSEPAIPSDGFESHYLYPGETKYESTYPVVDADGNLRRGNVLSAHDLGARGGVSEEVHERNLRALAKVFDPELDTILDSENDDSEGEASTPDEDVDGNDTDDVGAVDDDGDGESESPADVDADLSDNDGNENGDVCWVCGSPATHRNESTPPYEHTCDEHALSIDDVPIQGQIAASSADADDGLAGVIWGTGTHHLFLGGEPTPVFVPKETIQPTFEDLKERVAAGEATISFDHPDAGSVAAETSVGEIGLMREIALAANEEEIVLTETEVTNNKADEALESGEFDDLAYSMVGSLELEADEEGELIRENGGFRIAAASIKRADIVRKGAVDGAEIGRVPALAAGLLATAAEPPTDGVVAALAAARSSSETTPEQDTSMKNGNGLPSVPEDASDAYASLYSAAESMIEQKEAQIDDLESEVEAKETELESLEDEHESAAEKADAFAQIAAAHGLDLDDDEVDAQTVVDEHTQDVRERIAELEASLPDTETTKEDIEERADALAGKTVAQLEAKKGTLADKVLRAQQKANAQSGAIVADETPDNVTATTGSGSLVQGGAEAAHGGEPEKVDAMADACLDFIEANEAAQAGLSATQYVAEEYDLDASNYANEHALMAAISKRRRSGGDD